MGGYPEGTPYDMNFGHDDERPRKDLSIAAVPLPESDPVTGKNGDLLLR